MIKKTIKLGPADRLAILYSYPNLRNDSSSLAATIEHWFRLTLECDGIKGAKCTVINDRETYSLVLEGKETYADEFETYATRLIKFLQHGWTAYEYDIARIKAGRTIKPWDPVLNDWRFFLTHGLPLARPKCVQFFHYPPIRLLALQNYLDDPVPHRCEEMLVANGVRSTLDAKRYEAVMDACPIGASDEQGQMGTIPIDEFYAYQAAQTRLLIGDPQDTKYDEKTAWKNPVTIPIVVYGSHPKRVFSHLFLGDSTPIKGLDSKLLEKIAQLDAESLKLIDGKKVEDLIGDTGSLVTDGRLERGTLLDDTVCVAENIIAGKQTPVIGSRHPYAFYGQAQAGKSRSAPLPAAGQMVGPREMGTIGQGFIHPSYTSGGSEKLIERMIKDLVISGWQKEMAANPSQDPYKVYVERLQYWVNSAQKAKVCTLIIHQGSLWYPCFAEGKIPTPEEPATLEFLWTLELDAAADLVKNKNGDLPACIQALYDQFKASSSSKAKTKTAKKR